GLGGDFDLNQISMNGGIVDLSASPNFVLHFVNAGAGIAVTGGLATWTGANGHIQNDTAGPLSINITGSGFLNAGIALSAAGSNPNFSLNGNGMRLSNTGSTANITVNSSFFLYTNDLSTNVGSGAFGTLGTGTFTLNHGLLIYDGPTATCAKPVTLAGVGGGIVLNVPTSLTMN